MKQWLLLCIILVVCSRFALERSNAQSLWERVYPNEVYVKQTGLFQRTITWNQRSDAARVIIEAMSWTRPEGAQSIRAQSAKQNNVNDDPASTLCARMLECLQVGQYPYRYYVTEVITGKPGRYTFVQENPVRPDMYVGYYLTEYRYLDSDEPWYGYGVYWFEPAHLTLLPLIRH